MGFAVSCFVNIESGTSGDVFRAFVEQQLVPNLNAGDRVVMDNLSARKDARAAAAIRTCGADVIFLPPYSPECVTGQVRTLPDDRKVRHRAGPHDDVAVLRERSFEAAADHTSAKPTLRRRRLAAVSSSGAAARRVAKPDASALAPSTSVR